MSFNGFISYSHAADGRLAPAIQRGLHRLAKPWHRRRALWIFRDQTGLAVTPALWSSIEHAMDDSEYFVLLASPEAARSVWVNREIEHWVATKSADRILPVVTDGEWRWDPSLGDFGQDCTAVPAALYGVFAEEPLYLDLRWARDETQLSLRHSRFRDAIAQLAAPMHGLSKDELEGEDVRLHRRARRWQSAAIATLVVLTVLASLTGVIAVHNAAQASTATAEARHQQQVAADRQGSADRATAEARRQQGLATQQQARANEAAAETRRQQQLARDQKTLAVQAAAEATRQEQLAREQKALAAQASLDAGNQKANANRQRELADRAAARAREQERLAQQQRDLAARWAQEARRQEQAAQQQQEAAKQATDKATRQQAKADQQQRIAIGRQLTNEAHATIDEDPPTALMLGAAAATIQPDPDTRRQLAGLVASTHYAAALNDVNAIAYGPDGILAAIDHDGTSLWNMADPAKPVQLGRLGAFGLLGTQAFSPDGRTLLATGGGFAVSLWNVTDPNHPRRVGALPSAADVWSATFTPDGHTVATDNGEGTITLWDVTDEAEPRSVSTMVSDTFMSDGVVFSPDGRTAVTNADPATVWDITDRTNPRLVAKLDSLNTRPASLAFSRTGSILATGQWDGTVVLWDLTDVTQPRHGATLVGLSDGVLSAAFGPDGHTLAAGDEHGTTMTWDVADLFHALRLDSMSGNGQVTSVAFSPDGRTFATTVGGKAIVWSLSQIGAPKRLGAPADVPKPVIAVSFGPDGQIMATADDEGTVTVWDVRDPAHPVQRATVRPDGVPGTFLALSPDGRTLATAGRHGAVTVRDISDPTRPTMRARIDPPAQINGLLFSPDGRELIVRSPGTPAGDSTVWSLAGSGEPRLLATLSLLFTSPVAFSPDARIVATSDEHGAVALVDITHPSAPVRIAELAGHSQPVTALRFSPDGRTLASAAADQTVTLWDLADPTRARPSATVNSGNSNVRAVPFSPDGRLLAVGDANGSVIVWDITKGLRPVQVAKLHGNGFELGTIAFSPDGRTLATGGYSSDGVGHITIWDYRELNDLLADPSRYACAIAGHGLTPDDWAGYIPELPYQPTCPK